MTLRSIPNMVNHETNEVFFDNLQIPAENLIGVEGRGFKYLLDGLNAERALIAAECIGDGYWFVERATKYANERVVFDRPIGRNQGVQFPIAETYMEVEAANLMRFQACASGRSRLGNQWPEDVDDAKMGVVGLSTSIALDMARSGVNSNCIAPFAWSRMTASIPAAERVRVERLKSMTADKIAPLAVALLSDSARDISGQIFCVRKNEVFLFSQPRPIRSMHRAEGWTPQSISTDLFSAFRPSMQRLQRASEVFTWEPI